jgi:Rad3-related DNA helicase
MRFVAGQRQLELAAGEFARFGGTVSPRNAGGRWRAEVGRDWHDALKKRLEANGAKWEFEVSVRTFWIQDKWTLVVDGRVDQLRRDGTGAVEVREVKTVMETLPRPPEYWRQTRPAFFVQLALYCHALANAPENAGRPVRGTLVLADPATGILQEVPLGAPPEYWLEPVARELAHFAESRWTGRQRLEHLRLLNPFSQTRPEWLAAREQLDAAAATAPVVLLEAPTGFGKTALALDFALRRLRDGEVSRIIYVTGKNSGRIQVQRELERLVETGALRTFTLHSKDEHKVSGISDDPAVFQENWRRYGLDAARIFDTGAVSLDAVRALGISAGVPPWEITRALLPLAEFILCDYNYLFSPRHAGTLAQSLGWDASSALLIVDEAHNLPSRAAEARTLDADWRDARDTLDALRLAGAPAEWCRHWEAWADFLGELPRADALDGTAAYLLRDLCAAIARLTEERPPFGWVQDEAILDALFLPVRMCAAVGDGTDSDGTGEYLTWSPRAEQLRVECLEAAEEIGAVAHGFGRAVFMSATLAPEADFIASCGLETARTAWMVCEADWRADAYSVVVDARVDTRLKAREKHYRTTAEAVLALGATGPVAVFFPSYRYAETVATYVAALDAGFRVAVQPAGASPVENAAFVEEALLTAHALFLVMGGGLAEGVDMLGGRVTQAMVVSPGVPEVTPAQAARMALLERRGAADAFRSTYLIPAMRKVNQSLGRLVRGPGQRVRVVLHCRRFAEPSYASLLAPEYCGGVVVRNENEWAAAIR